MARRRAPEPVRRAPHQLQSAVVALDEGDPGGTARRGHDRRIPATFLLYAQRA